MKKLPEKKSKLIRLALKNLQECENDSNYKVNMARWHKLDAYDNVQVWLGGSVIAKTLVKGFSRYSFSPSKFGKIINDSLWFLSDLLLDGDFIPNVMPYELDPEQCLSELDFIAEEYERVGD